MRDLLSAGFPANLIGVDPADVGVGSQSERDKLGRWLSLVEEGKVIRSIGGRHCGFGVLLYGTPGTGKTMMAAHAAQRIADMTDVFVWGPLNRIIRRPLHPVRFTYFPELLETQKRVYDNDANATDLMDSYHGRGQFPTFVLVVDDLGKEQRTEWAWTRLDSLLRVRHQNGLPTIVTTNVPPKQWSSVYGEAMSNFLDRTMLILPVKGEE